MGQKRWLKPRLIGGLAFATAMGVGAGIFVMTSETPTTIEIESREVYPGYSFIYNGETNLIERKRSARVFTEQHPMMPYLEIFLEYFKYRPNWSYSDPILIQETETQVIITLPSWAERMGHKRYWGSSYNMQVIIDKKTKAVVSALQG